MKLEYYLQALDKAYKDRIKYVGMLRLLRAVFSKYDSGGRKSWEESLFEALDTLNERERKVLKLRFGLLDNNFRTLEQVAKEFGVTRERIRQIEGKAIRKLKHPSRRLVLLGASWQIATQDAKQMGEKLLLDRSEQMKGKTPVISYYETENIGLPTRVANPLIKHGYGMVYDIIKESDENLLKVRNLGPKSVRMIREVLEKVVEP